MSFRHLAITTAAALGLSGGVALAQPMTDVDNAQYQPGGSDMDSPMTAPYAAAPAAMPAPMTDSYTSDRVAADRVTQYGKVHPLGEQLQNENGGTPYSSSAPVAPHYAMENSDASLSDTTQDFSMPDVQNGANGSSYISGGVTSDERAKFDGMAHSYSLKLANSNMAGELVSDVDVKITDAKGAQIFEATTDGPILLAKLPGGKYKIVSTHDGATKTQAVDIGKGLKSINVIWK